MRASGEENAFLALVETTELRSHESSDRLEAVILVLTAQVVVNAIHSGAGGFVVFENIIGHGMVTVKIKFCLLVLRIHHYKKIDLVFSQISSECSEFSHYIRNGRVENGCVMIR